MIKATQAVWYLAITLLVVVATYVALGRNFFGSVAVLKDSLEDKLSEVAGVPVTVGELRGEWDGFDPVLKLTDVWVWDPVDEEARIMELDTVMVQPDMVASLFNLGLIFRHIELGDVAVNVEQGPKGGWSLSGFPALSESRDTDWEWQGLNDLLASPTLEFRDIRIHWKFRNISPTTWLIPIMKLQTGDKGIQASGFIHQLEDNEPLGLFSLAEKQDQSEDGLNADLYLAWRNSALLNPLMEMLESGGTRVTGFQSRGSAWIHVTGGQVKGLTTEIDVSDIQWQREYETQEPIKHLAGLFRIDRSREEWRLRAADIEMDWQDQSLELEQLLADARFVTDSSGTQLDNWQLQFDRINVGFLKDLATASGLLPERLQKAIADYSPSGWINRLKIESSSQTGPVVTAELESVAVKAHGGAPGGKRISGYLSAAADRGAVVFSGKRLLLDFPDLFYNDWTFQYAEGIVKWRLFDDYTFVSGQDLSLTDPDQYAADLKGQFSILLPSAEDEAETFELAIGINQTDARLTPLFVPGHVVSADLYNWLERAVVTGTITQGGYFYSGAVGTLAHEGNYRSQMYFNLEDAELKFSDDWPALKDFKGTLTIDNDQVSGVVSSGKLAVSQLNDVELSMSKDPNGEHILNIDTQFSPTKEDWKFWLLDSPVAEHTRPVVEGWEIDGESQVELSVVTNLDREESRVRIGADLQALNIYLEEYGLGITDVVGALQFDSDLGVYSEGLDAQILGNQARLQLSTKDWLSDSKGVLLEASGRSSVAEVERWLDAGHPLNIKGEFGYDFKMAVDSGEHTRFDLGLTSDLKGVELSMPPPLNKRAQQIWPLNLNYQWDTGVGEGLVSVDIKDLVSLKLVNNSQGITRGVVNLDQQGTKRFPASGVDVRGRLAALEAEVWQEYLGSLAEEANNVEKVSINRGQVSWPDWLNQVNIDVGHLVVSSEEFQEIHLDLIHENKTLLLALEDESRIKGILSYPLQDEGVLSASFDRLYLNDQSGQLNEGELLPSDVPLGQFRIGDLKIGTQAYGSWSWTARQREGGIVFNQVVGKLSGAELHARLSWLYDPVTGVHNSILTGDISGKGFADLYHNWSENAPLTAETYVMNAGLVWSQSPLDFSWENVSGQVSMNMETGVINEASSGTDLFRIFGILNTDSIIRRLKLDFSDLYKKGLAYDRIEGNARIREGVVTMETPLAIQGPSSAYKITGKTSLVDDSLDLQMVVVLPVTQNLPLAALLVGAPQVGGALFLIDKLLGEPLSSLTSATYEIKGTFQEPEMKLQQMFDQSRKPRAETGKSKVE
ncbi:YhdP family protein [Hahella ganghwensis]|uniref:YhdP family protein n=1 Tax=Hahella ganghwensis TaxID=286420 RepID=UPI00039EA7BA|nr:YhdP family protein [Hahella ganghwensis]